MLNAISKEVLMGEVLETVAELSRMHRDLGSTALEALREDKGNYVDRLKAVADRSFMHSMHLSGSTTMNPHVLTQGRTFETKKEVLKGHGMYYRDLRTSEGTLYMFPLRITGLTRDRRILIDPSDLYNSYSIVHVPHKEPEYSHDIDTMRVDMAFTANRDNLVTVDGMNPATAKEHALFEDLVLEFESRVSGISDDDMRYAREVALLGR
jgi:hypothetical protein